jgi:hypothetical protein
MHVAYSYNHLELLRRMGQMIMEWLPKLEDEDPTVSTLLLLEYPQNQRVVADAYMGYHPSLRIDGFPS